MFDQLSDRLQATLSDVRSRGKLTEDDVSSAMRESAGGRCACGGWICPVCMGCQAEELDTDKKTACADQRKRFIKKAASEHKHSAQRRP